MKERGKQPPVPENLALHLNEDQLRTIRTVENFGWELWFVRRPLFQDVTVVLKHCREGTVKLLTDSGELITDTTLILRD
jgi:hypothetical protein